MRSRLRRAPASRRVGAAFAAVAVATVLAGCGGGGGGNSILVYNGQHPELTSALVAAFEKQTGIDVQVRTADSIVLADQILQEGSASPADVYIAENSPELVTIDEHHQLASSAARRSVKFPRATTRRPATGPGSHFGSAASPTTRRSCPPRSYGPRSSRWPSPSGRGGWPSPPQTRTSRLLWAP